MYVHQICTFQKCAFYASFVLPVRCNLSVQMTAVVAVGLVEGTTHVNWPKVGQILKWWLGTLIPLSLITALLFGQGTATFHQVHPDLVYQSSCFLMLVTNQGVGSRKLQKRPVHVIRSPVPVCKLHHASCGLKSKFVSCSTHVVLSPTSELSPNSAYQ